MSDWVLSVLVVFAFPLANDNTNIETHFARWPGFTEIECSKLLHSTEESLFEKSQDPDRHPKILSYSVSCDPEED